MGVKITKKQKRILDFIVDFTDKNGLSPTYREIAAGIGQSILIILSHWELFEKTVNLDAYLKWLT